MRSTPSACSGNSHTITADRFPDTAAQIAGFVLTPDGSEVRALRWVPSTDGDAAPTSETLLVRYNLPTRSIALLDRALRAPPPPGGILVLILTPDGQRYDAGDFDLREYIPPTVVLERRHRPVRGGDADAHTPPSPAPTGTVAERYAAVFQAWGVDAVWGDPVIALPTAATLYGVLERAAVEWCGESTRFGANALLWDIPSRYPDRSVFAAAKGHAAAHRFPVVLCYGDPTNRPTPDRRGFTDNCGVQTILFRPGTGESTRAHFRAHTATTACLAMRELGEEEEVVSVRPSK